MRPCGATRRCKRVSCAHVACAAVLRPHFWPLLVPLLLLLLQTILQARAQDPIEDAAPPLRIGILLPMTGLCFATLGCVCLRACCCIYAHIHFSNNECTCMHACACVYAHIMNRAMLHAHAHAYHGWPCPCPRPCDDSRHVGCVPCAL